MALTPEEREWLSEQSEAMKRELDALVSGKSRPAYTDKNERRIELMEGLDEIERQLREDEKSED